MQFLETHHRTRLASGHAHPRPASPGTLAGHHRSPSGPTLKRKPTLSHVHEVEPKFDPASAAVITIQRAQIIFAPVAEVLKETDMKNRRGKNVWWKDIRALVELIGGRQGEWAWRWSNSKAG